MDWETNPPDSVGIWLGFDGARTFRCYVNRHHGQLTIRGSKPQHRAFPIGQGQALPKHLSAFFYYGPIPHVPTGRLLEMMLDRAEPAPD